MQISERYCRVCGSRDDTITTQEGEVVCRCGAIIRVVEHNEHAGPVSPAGHVGTANVADPKIGLRHLDPQRTTRMMERSDRYTNAFHRTCEKMGLTRAMRHDALKMFLVLHPLKLGTGRTAAFCIYQSYADRDVLADADRITETVRSCFSLSRRLDMRDALYRVKPAAIEAGLVRQGDEPSEKFMIKKHIRQEKHVISTRLMDSFGAHPTRRARVQALKRFIEAYM